MLTRIAWRTTGRMVARDVVAESAGWPAEERTVDALIDTSLTRGTQRPDDAADDAFYRGVLDVVEGLRRDK